jgi:general secretion pathway protein N
MMRSPTKPCSAATFLLVTALGASAASQALPTDDPDLYATRSADIPPMSAISNPPGTPEPIVIVQTPEQTPVPARALSPNPLWEIPLSNLSSTRERPIFSPSRRPPPVVTAAPLAAPASPPAPKSPRVERPQLSLVGTVSGDNEQFGIFIDQTTKAALRLRIGEDYQGWKLRAVQSREVRLEFEQQTAILTLPQPGTTVGQPFRRPWVDSAAAQTQIEAPPRRDQRR